MTVLFLSFDLFHCHVIIVFFSLSPLVVIQNHGYVVFIYKINSIYFHFCTFLELYSIKEIVVIEMPVGCSLWAALGIAF